MRIIDPFDFAEHFDKCLDYLPHYQTSAGKLLGPFYPSPECLKLNFPCGWRHFVFLFSDTLRTALDLDPDSALEQTLRKHIMKNLLKKVIF